MAKFFFLRSYSQKVRSGPHISPLMTRLRCSIPKDYQGTSLIFDVKGSKRQRGPGLVRLVELFLVSKKKKVTGIFRRFGENLLPDRRDLR